MNNILVKIQRDSIRKNPNAGRTSFVVHGPSEIRFKYQGNNPELLKNCTIISEHSSGEVEGYIDNPDDIKELANIPGMKIEVKNNFTRHEHLPEPQYLYEYEDPKIKCSQCKEDIYISKIHTDYDDWDNEYTECPNCKGVNTFPEIQYEHIQDALKSPN